MPSVSRTGRRPSQSASGSSVVRRPSRATHPPVAPLKPLTHQEALEALRAFLKERSSYDVFPVSFRLIVLDSQLKVKKALDVMLLYGEQTIRLPLSAGVVSAPLWNTASATFAGMFTVQDVIHLIQYYYHTSSWEGAAADVEQFRLQSLRGERTIDDRPTDDRYRTRAARSTTAPSVDPPTAAPIRRVQISYSDARSTVAVDRRGFSDKWRSGHQRVDAVPCPKVHCYERAFCVCAVADTDSAETSRNTSLLEFKSWA